MYIYLRCSLAIILLLFVTILFSRPLSAVEPWLPALNTPVSISNHDSVILDNRIYIIGGSNTMVPRVSLYSNLNQDGTLSSWQSTSSVLEGRYWLTSVQYNNGIYVLGGADSSWNTTNSVYLGKVASNGDIQDWQALTPLPKTLANGDSTIVGNRIYYAGGNTDSRNNFWGSIVNDIYMSEINITDNTIGPWVLISSLPQKAIGFSMISINDYLYIFGGRSSAQIYSAVYRAKVDADTGFIGAWQPLPNLPKPLWVFGLTKINDKVVAAGGHDGSSFLSSVYFSTINSDGTLTSWETSSSNLPKVNAGFSMASWKDKTYITGGHDGLKYFNDVYFSDISTIINNRTPSPSPSPPPLPSPSPTLIPLPVSKTFLIPGMGGSWNTHAFVTCSFDPDVSHWTLSPYAEDIYRPAIFALESAGWDVKMFNYDWRQEITTNSNLLKTYINSVTENNEKVNIIGHSMGGLVGRDYLEKNIDSRLNSLLTIGSPHKGSALAYPPWGGGDIWNDNFIAKIAITLYLKHCGNKSSNDRVTIQNIVPSLQNILPTEAYLREIRATDNYLPSHQINQNNWPIHSLNPGSVKVGSIAGSGFDTLNVIQTKEASKKDFDMGNWIDGRPIGKFYSDQGDGTVLVSSAILPEANYYKILNETHSTLMNSLNGIAEILKFLGAPSPTSISSTIDNSTSALIVIGYPAMFTLTDHEGNTKNDKDGMISFGNPKPGIYRLTIFPKSENTTLIVAQFLPNGNVLYKEYKFNGLGPKLKLLNFNLDNPTIDILK